LEKIEIILYGLGLIMASIMLSILSYIAISVIKLPFSVVMFALIFDLITFLSIFLFGLALIYIAYKNTNET
jgi:hypothetical protein